jgi:hypothetical protein
MDFETAPIKKYHPLVAVVLIIFGGAAAVTTLVQIRQTRIGDLKTRNQEKEEKDKLQGTIDGLKKQVNDLSTNSIPQLLGDVEELKPSRPPKPLLPDLTVRLVHPQEVAIVIDNASHAGIADRPKYGVALTDVDNLGADFLKIPTQMGDYIRPGESWGPNELMGIDAVKSVVKHGDRIVGSVSISCPTCMKTRGYWVFIKAGDGGWYAEQEGSPKAIANRAAAEKLASNFDAYADILAPKSKRTPIK